MQVRAGALIITPGSSSIGCSDPAQACIHLRSSVHRHPGAVRTALCRAGSPRLMGASETRRPCANLTSSGETVPARWPLDEFIGCISTDLSRSNCVVDPDHVLPAWYSLKGRLRVVGTTPLLVLVASPVPQHLQVRWPLNFGRGAIRRFVSRGHHASIPTAPGLPSLDVSAQVLTS